MAEGCQGRMTGTQGGYHELSQLPHNGSERKVRVKQKESIKNAIMEDMKQPTDKLVSQQWGSPTAQLIQNEDGGGAATKSGR